MNRLQILCINKTDRYNPHERIRFIGGLNSSGTRWKLPLADAISGIESRTYSFYVKVGGWDEVNVIIATHLGYKYLKTQNDGEQPNNLLSLPECP